MTLEDELSKAIKTWKEGLAGALPAIAGAAVPIAGAGIALRAAGPALAETGAVVTGTVAGTFLKDIGIMLAKNIGGTAIGAATGVAIGSTVASFVKGAIDQTEARATLIQKQYIDGFMDRETFIDELGITGLRQPIQDSLIKEADTLRPAGVETMKQKEAKFQAGQELAASFTPEDAASFRERNPEAVVGKTQSEISQLILNEKAEGRRKTQEAQMQEQGQIQAEQDALAAAERGNEEFNKFVLDKYGEQTPGRVFITRHPELKKAFEIAKGDIQKAAEPIRIREMKRRRGAFGAANV